MNKTTKLRAIMLSLMMLIGLLPLTSFAQQRNDDFFRVDDAYSGNRDVLSWTIVNNGIGQPEAPLGSGLLILFAVGAGYAITRRKRNLKKVATLFLALVLTLNLTNCRKNLETINSVPSNGVYITLNVDGSSRVIVDPTGHTDPNYATVTFENNDVIYVGNNGAYCGYLTYDGEKFGGTITPTSGDDGDYLHFYFMGNKGAKSEPTSVNISDQTSKYPVISYGRSSSLYHSSTTSYSARLLNKCAISKFTISGVDTDKVITITGMKNTVTVDFSKNGTGDVVNPYTYSKTGSGEIRLHAESNTERWAILLPQDEVTTATAYAAGYTTTANFTVPAVSANGYYDSGVAVAMASGSPKGAFTINASGDQVFFSPGNLQAVFASAGTSCTWQFAEHQYDYIGGRSNGGSGDLTGNNYINGNGSVSTAGAVDLFSWSTNATYYGIHNSDDAATYSGAFYDWGNAIGSGWRTLTKAEWVWVLGPSEDTPDPGTNCRTSSTVNGVENARYAKATVVGKAGLIIFPDSYTHPGDATAPASVNTAGAAYTVNSYDATAWGKMEAAGAVFLPAAGIRPAGINNYVLGCEVTGGYWSSVPLDDQNAYFLLFQPIEVTPSGYNPRNTGCSVRLVKDAN